MASNTLAISKGVARFAKSFSKKPILTSPIERIQQAEDGTCTVHESGQEAFHALADEIVEGLPEEAQEVHQEAEDTGEDAASAPGAGEGAAARGSAAVCGLVLFAADGTLVDGIALLGKLASVIILSIDGLTDGPGVAQGGDGLGFGLAAEGAGQKPGTGEGAGGRGGAGLGPGVGAGGIRAGGGVRVLSGAVHQVVDGIIVGNGVPGGIVCLGNGDVFVAVSNRRCRAAAQGEGITAVLVVVGPVCDRVGLASGGVVVGVVRLVDNGVALDLGDLAVVADDSVVAGDGGGAGINVVGGGYGGSTFLVKGGDLINGRRITHRKKRHNFVNITPIIKKIIVVKMTRKIKIR